MTQSKNIIKTTTKDKPAMGPKEIQRDQEKKAKNVAQTL